MELFWSKALEKATLGTQVDRGGSRKGGRLKCVPSSNRLGAGASPFKLESINGQPQYPSTKTIIGRKKEECLLPLVVLWNP